MKARPSGTRSVVLLTVGTAGAAVLSLAYSVGVGRLLGPGAFGDFTSVLALVTFVFMALSPLNEAVAKFTAVRADGAALGQVHGLHSAATRYLWRRVFGAALLLACVLAVVEFGGAGWPAGALGLGVGVIFLNLVVSVPRGVMRGLEAYGAYGLIMVVESGVRLVGGLVLVLLIPSAGSAVAGYGLGLGVAWAASRTWVRTRLRGSSPAPFDPGPLWAFSVPMLALALSAAAMQNFDMVVVRGVARAEIADVGLFGAAFTLARGVSMVFLPFGIFVLPRLTRSYGAAGVEGLLASLGRIGLLLLAVVSLPLALLVVWPTEILLLAFGSGFVPAATFVLPLALARAATLFTYVVGLAAVAVDAYAVVWAIVAGVGLQVAAMIWFRDSIASMAWASAGALAVGLLGATVLLGVFLLARIKSAPAPATPPE